MHIFLTVELTGTVMILVVLLLRTIFSRKLTHNMIRISWMLPVTMMLIPYRVPSRYGIGNSIVNAIPTRPQNIMTFDVTNTVFSAFLKTMHDGPGETTWWFVLWAGIAIGIVFCFFCNFLRCWREFSTSLPIDDEKIISRIELWQKEHQLSRPISIRQLDTIHSPLTYRVIKPVVLLPKRMIQCPEKRELEFVLEHEFFHIKKNDELFKLLLIAVVCIHWFNPYAWVMLFAANEDIELACDESVMRSLGYRYKKDYAYTLIRLESNLKGSSFYNNFSTNDLSVRFSAINNKVKTSYLWTLICASFLLIISGMASVTNSGYESRVPLWTEDSQWIHEDGLRHTMYEFRGGRWIKQNGITIVLDSKEDKLGEITINNPSIANNEYQKNNSEYMPEWKEVLETPEEGMRVLFDNWGNVEELYVVGSNGMYIKARRYWNQVT